MKSPVNKQVKPSSPSYTTSTISPNNKGTPYVYKKGGPVPPAIAARAKQVAESRSKTTTSIPIADGQLELPQVALSELKLGKLLGHGSYSSAYEIKEGKGISFINKQRNRIKMKHNSHKNNASSPTNSSHGSPTNGTNNNHQNHKKQILKQLSPKVKENPLLFAACAADLIQEGQILHLIGTAQPNIIDIYAWSGPNMISDYLQGNPDNCSLVLELLVKTLDKKFESWQLASTSMWYYVYEETTQPEYLKILAEKCRYILGMARALEHLHQHRVLHRDLKPANIGFNQEGVLKVFDFDLARVLPPPPTDGGDDLFQMTNNVGSPRYMAPEIKLKDQKYNCSADVYSFGILVYQLLTLEVPISTTVRDWSTENKYIPTEWSKELRHVMGDCLKGADHLLERPTMAKIVEELDKCPTVKQPKRTTPTKAAPKTELAETTNTNSNSNPTHAKPIGPEPEKKGWLW
ncbi:unnamed protein product [Cylindrotheca closterium]|uniref:Protein kinase domain-containing protein n=1 Tax=Cylindrotheca closterium TaxID=2856 RepID=A0AAD2FXW3_9STRA|nr:unnamed protein product [Cylindrotheca closterium]